MLKRASASRNTIQLAINKKEGLIMTSALILAAGNVFGDDIRGPTQNVGKISAIRRIIMVFRQAGVEKTVVVTGFDADALQRHCAHMGAIFLRNDE